MRKNAIFLPKIAENCGHNIDPLVEGIDSPEWPEWAIFLFVGHSAYFKLCTFKKSIVKNSFGRKLRIKSNFAKFQLIGF
jgi:hypothetical protein